MSETTERVFSVTTNAEQGKGTSERPSWRVFLGWCETNDAYGWCEHAEHMDTETDVTS